MSYINIHKVFNAIADAHIEVNSFEMGSITDIGAKLNEAYPQLFIDDFIFCTVKNGYMDQNLYTLNLFLVDREEKLIDMSNPITVLNGNDNNPLWHKAKIINKCEQIMMQILSALYKSNTIHLQEDPNIEYLIDPSVNGIIGVKCEIGILFPSASSDCDIDLLMPNLDLDVLCL